MVVPSGPWEKVALGHELERHEHPKAALAAYQDHPDHKALGARLVANAKGGLDGILVFDLPFDPSAQPGA